MALTSVLDIKLNDDAFKSYKRAFDEYKGAVDKLPGAWDKVDKKIKGTKAAFNALVAEMAAANVEEKQRLAAQKEADKLTRSQADHWRSMAKSSKELAGNVVKTTESFLRWVGPVSILTGLLGAGAGLFGLDRLGERVTAQRRTAGGLGIGYGETSAFGLNYGRFVDTRGLLGGVSGALYNATSSGYTGLLSAGLSEQFLSTHNAAEVSAELIDRLPGLFKSTPRHLVGAQASALGLDQVIPTEDIVRLINASPGERKTQSDQYRKDRGRLDLDKETQRAWNDFVTQLDRAGQGIQNTFVRGLVLLTGPLQELSAAFEKLVQTLLGSEAAQKAIKGLTSGLESLAKYIGTDSFQQDVKDFVSGIASMAKAVKGFVSYFAAPDEKAASAAGVPAATMGMGTNNAPQNIGQAKRNYWLNRAFGRYTPGETTAGDGEDETKPNASFNRTFKRYTGATTSDEGKVYASREERKKFIKQYAASIGIDPSVAWRVAKMEGGGTGKTNPWDVDGPSGGDFQLHYNAKGNALGDQYTARTGHRSTDTTYWQEQDMYALDHARKHGWGDWSTMRGHDPYEGIGQRPIVTLENRTGADVNVSAKAAINN